MVPLVCGFFARWCGAGGQNREVGGVLVYIYVTIGTDWFIEMLFLKFVQ